MITTNVDEFLKRFKAKQQLTLNMFSNTVNKTAVDMYSKIVERTPVGDPSLWQWPAHADYQPGTLKKSWSLSFNGVQRNVSGQFASTSQILGNNGVSFKIGNNQAQMAMIFNPQPYAQRVETGWSSQAPQGMLRITVAEYTSIFAQNAKKYRIS